LAHFAWRWNRFTVLLFRSSLIITLVAGLIKIVLGTIALSPFVELGVNIQQAVAKRRHPSPLVHAAKLTALASSIIGLSLVQVALLSMAEPKADHSRYNAWGGIFCGAIAITIGVGMIIRSSHHLRRLAVV
jgi:uncharacterized membrane protein